MSRRSHGPEAPAPSLRPAFPLPEEGGSYVWDGETMTPGEQAPPQAPLALPAAQTNLATTQE